MLVNAGKATIVSALLIAAIADNLTDSLSVPYLGSRVGALGAPEAFRWHHVQFRHAIHGMSQFRADRDASGRGGQPPWPESSGECLYWLRLPSSLPGSARLAVVSEIAKHLVVAAMVLFVSRGVGLWICRCVS